MSQKTAKLKDTVTIPEKEYSLLKDLYRETEACCSLAAQRRERPEATMSVWTASEKYRKYRSLTEVPPERKEPEPTPAPQVTKPAPIKRKPKATKPKRKSPSKKHVWRRW